MDHGESLWILIYEPPEQNKHHTVTKIVGAMGAEV
jgi:hypothetical protein